MHKAIKILIASSIFYNMAAGLLGPIWAIYVGTVGGSILDAGSAYAVYTFFVGLLMLVLGRLEDKLNRRVMFVFGRFLNFVGTTGYLFVTNITELFIVQGVLGAALAIINPTFTTIYSKSIDKGRESSEWAYWEGSVHIMYSIVAFSGGVIASLYGFRTLFILMSIASLCSLIVSLLLLKKKIKNEILVIEGKKKVKTGKKMK
ncbi:MAG TPA: MFS transporter [archaeon]|nr:MFS transporter [archaeon]